MRGHYHLYSSHTLDISEKNSNTRLFIYISVLFRKPVLIKACQGHFNSNTICHSQCQNKNHRLSTCECCFNHTGLKETQSRMFRHQHLQIQFMVIFFLHYQTQRSVKFMCCVLLFLHLNIDLG